MNKTMQLKLGDTIYGIYRGECILPYTVYALGFNSFIVDGYRNKEDDAQEWWFDDFGEKWFTDLKAAKRKLWKLHGNNRTKYEMKCESVGQYSMYIR